MSQGKRPAWCDAFELRHLNCLLTWSSGYPNRVYRHAIDCEHPEEHFPPENRPTLVAGEMQR